MKYKGTFLRKGMLGKFILPFFVSSLLVGVSGIVVMVYRWGRMGLTRLLSATYSVKYQTAVLNMKDINLHPNVLVLFGILLVLMGLLFTLVALKHTKPGKDFKRVGPLSLIGYLFVYLLAYAFILATSIYKMMFRKNYSW